MPLQMSIEDTKNNLWLIKHNGFTVGTIVERIDNTFDLELVIFSSILRET